MNRTTILSNLIAELESFPEIKLLDAKKDKERFSRDFFDYSPVLEQKLGGCIADLVVRPHSVKGAALVAGACKRNGVPLTLRGSGTGNYGQCVPLSGGIVMLMGNLNEIRDINISTGVVTVETGCLLGDLEKKLLSQGRQLRLLPSTWRSASIGGFVAGGSGGIGSVRWGFLRDPGNVLGMEIITVEDDPQILQLDEKASEAINHAYGTNGIISALTIATSPAVAWKEVAIDCGNWGEAVDLMQRCSRSAVELRLCSLLEKNILEKIPEWSGPSMGKHRLLLLVAPDGITTIQRLAESAEAHFTLLGSENLQSGTGLRELSWNHTTLHMRSSDRAWTYLQLLLPQPEIEAMNILKSRWGDDLLWHLESVSQQGMQRLAALPLVKWKGNDSLNELMNHCRDLGAVLFNPHVITVEDGGLGVIDSEQVKAKQLFDPEGILNPGKLKGWKK